MGLSIRAISQRNLPFFEEQGACLGMVCWIDLILIFFPKPRYQAHIPENERANQGLIEGSVMTEIPHEGLKCLYLGFIKTDDARITGAKFPLGQFMQKLSILETPSIPPMRA